MSAGNLILDKVSLGLEGRHLLGPLSVEIAVGTCLTVMGPSGSGKSSLLGFVTGTLDAVFRTSGRVLIGSEPIDQLRTEQRGIGMLFQDDLLFPHLSVAGNLGFALQASGLDRRERRSRIESALSSAGLAGFADRDPATLSGGQRARVALMRTLLASPRVLLLDEPFSKLDARLRQDIRHFVFAHARERGLPMLLVTHDQADADAAAGPVIRLSETATY